MGEPFGVGDHAVEAVAMQHQKSPAVGGLMDRLVHDLDAGEHAARIVASELVMIAGHEDHACAGIHLAQQFCDHPALRVRPVPAALELPAIDDVAHQKQRVARIAREEIGEHLGLAAARAQMGVGDEDGAMATCAAERFARSRPGGGATRGGAQPYARGKAGNLSLDQANSAIGRLRFANQRRSARRIACLQIATCMLRRDDDFVNQVERT